MKENLHKHLVVSVLEVLKQTFEEDRFADKTLERLFKNQKKWGARDRRFVAESVYEMVRWWRRLWFQAGRDVAFQESDLWYLFAQWWTSKGKGLPQWPEFKGFKAGAPQSMSRAVQESIPDWLDERGAKELGERWPSVLRSLNEQAPVVLRTNTLKSNRADVAGLLLKETVETEPVATAPDALKLKVRKNVFITDVFKKGLFEVQDASSQMVAPFTQVKPGERVVDACAGGGGKTLHLASLMKNKGKIIAMDLEDWKLRELRQRTSRAGVDIVETRAITSHKVIKRCHNDFDLVLLDVPCSGTGVLRRNPDMKWKLSPDWLEEVILIQRDILRQYSKMARANGRLVYATCSVFPSENEEQVRWFLEQVPGWELSEEKRLWPDTDGFDGFYMARLSRRG